MKLLSLIIAALIVNGATPSGAPDGRSSAGTGETRQALRGAPQAGDTTLTTVRKDARGISGRTGGSYGAPLVAVTRHKGFMLAANPAVTRQGLVSWVDPRYGRYYLALPYPRGTRATICGIGGCITRTSTDYGPSQRIHPDRIADLSAVDWEHICGMDRRYGLCPATLTILKRGTGPAPRAAPTAPPTDILEGP